MELVETFLVIFQASVSGLSRSDKEELAVHIIPEVNVVINPIVLILMMILMLKILMMMMMMMMMMIVTYPEPGSWIVGTSQNTSPAPFA